MGAAELEHKPEVYDGGRAGQSSGNRDRAGEEAARGRSAAIRDDTAVDGGGDRTHPSITRWKWTPL